MSSNFFMLCCYSSTIIHDMSNSITYIDGSTIFLNATRDMSFEDTMQIIYGRLELNYNDV